MVGKKFLESVIGITVLSPRASCELARPTLEKILLAL